MKTKDLTTLATVHNVEWRNNSIYGNPSYWVCFTTEDDEFLRAYTAPNSASGYGCRNFEGGKCKITYHYTPSGKCVIDYMRKPAE